MDQIENLKIPPNSLSIYTAQVMEALLTVKELGTYNLTGYSRTYKRIRLPTGKKEKILCKYSSLFPVDRGFRFGSPDVFWGEDLRNYQVDNEKVCRHSFKTLWIGPRLGQAPCSEGGPQYQFGGLSVCFAPA